MERIIDRFDKYMEYRGLNDNRVTVQLNISRSRLAKSREENRELSKKMIELILNFYNDIEEKWLLSGIGEMIKEEFRENDSEQQKQNDLAEQKDDESWYKDIIKSQQEIIASQQKTISDLTSMISSQKTEVHVQEDTDAVCAAVAG
jgi:hypothetical protein